jgi:hypothetical protein
MSLRAWATPRLFTVYEAMNHSYPVFTIRKPRGSGLLAPSSRSVQRAGLIPTIVGMGVVYIVVTIGMFFNPALRGMDVRHEPGAEPVDLRTAAEHAEAMKASRTTDIR